MRVLHATDCYLPRLGGIETHVGDLTRHQRGSGHDARVLTATPAGVGGAVDPGWVVRTGSALGRRGVDVDRVLAEHDPDVLHAHLSVVSPFALGVARAAAQRGIPTLLTVHSMWGPWRPLPSVAGGLVGLADWPVGWSAVSEAAARHVRQALGPGADVAVLPNAVDPAAWRPGGAPGPAGRPVTLVSVMRFTRTKRTLPLARMLRAVRATVPADVPLRAVVVGDGPQRAALERHLARWGMTQWVDLPGRLTRAEIRQRLLAADVFVAPAELESFGIAALEARALGLPVVASARSGVAEFVRHGREGLLAEDDVAMTAALARLVVDPALRERIRRHNSTVPIEHDWPRALARTDDLYAAAAARGVRSGRMQVATGTVSA